MCVCVLCRSCLHAWSRALCQGHVMYLFSFNFIMAIETSYWWEMITWKWNQCWFCFSPRTMPLQSIVLILILMEFQNLSLGGATERWGCQEITFNKDGMVQSDSFWTLIPGAWVRSHIGIYGLEINVYITTGQLGRLVRIVGWSLTQWHEAMLTIFYGRWVPDVLEKCPTRKKTDILLFFPSTWQDR